MSSNYHLSSDFYIDKDNSLSHQNTIVAEFSATEKKYAEVTALDGLTLEVRSGEILGLLGPNGAGKTTAIRTLLGISKPSGGIVRVYGRDPSKFGRQEKAKVGWVAQQSTADPLLTGREYISMIARLYDIPNSRRAVAHTLEQFGLLEHADRVIRTYSGGMLKRLEIAAGTIHDPDILILDEPTAALDVTTRHQLWDLVRSLKRSGRTVILTTHYLDEADVLCDQVAIMNDGKSLVNDSPEQLKSRFNASNLDQVFAMVTGKSIDPSTGTELQDVTKESLGTTQDQIGESPRDNGHIDENGPAKKPIPVEKLLSVAGLKSFIQANITLTQRWIWRLSRDRYTLGVTVLQPILWLVLFGQMWEGVVRSDWARDGYLQFITAGAVMMSVFNFAAVVGLELLLDRERGTLDRIAASPAQTSSMVTSRLIFVAGIGAIQALAVVMVASLLGVSLAGGLAAIPALAAIAMALAMGIGAISIGLGLTLTNHGQFYSVTGLAALPMVLISTVFAPLDVMPGWLAFLAQINPVSHAVDGSRYLVSGDGTSETMWINSGIVIGFTTFAIVFAVFAVRRLVTR